MLGLGKIFELFSNFNLTRLEVKEELCLNYRFKQKVCNKCAEVCPNSIINVEGRKLIVKKDNCNSCGFCYQVCPTGVFNILEGSNAKLTSEIRNLANKESRLKIYCSQHKRKFKDGLEIVCLGRLDEKLLLEGLLAGATDIWIVDTDCTDCKMQIGEELFKEVLSTCQDLLQANSIQNRIYYTNDEPIEEKRSSLKFNKIEANNSQTSEESFNRRDLFKVLKKGVRQANTKQFKDKGTLPLKQDRLLQLIKSLDIRPTNLPWLEFSSDCDFCQGCSHLCPTDALKTEEEERLTFKFNPLLCTSCQLCEISCFYNAVKLTDFKNNNKVQLVANELDRHYELFSGYKARCQQCDDEFYTAKAEQKVCFNCQYVAEVIN